jgi:hypothetical protein
MPAARQLRGVERLVRSSDVLFMENMFVTVYALLKAVCTITVRMSTANSATWRTRTTLHSTCERRWCQRIILEMHQMGRELGALLISCTGTLLWHLST